MKTFSLLSVSFTIDDACSLFLACLSINVDYFDESREVFGDGYCFVDGFFLTA